MQLFSSSIPIQGIHRDIMAYNAVALDAGSYQLRVQVTGGYIAAADHVLVREERLDASSLARLERHGRLLRADIGRLVAEGKLLLTPTIQRSMRTLLDRAEQAMRTAGAQRRSVLEYDTHAWRSAIALRPTSHSKRYVILERTVHTHSQAIGLGARRLDCELAATALEYAQHADQRVVVASTRPVIATLLGNLSWLSEQLRPHGELSVVRDVSERPRRP